MVEASLVRELVWVVSFDDVLAVPPVLCARSRLTNDPTMDTSNQSANTALAVRSARRTNSTGVRSPNPGTLTVSPLEKPP